MNRNRPAYPSGARMWPLRPCVNDTDVPTWSATPLTASMLSRRRLTMLLTGVRRIRQRCQESIEINKADADATIQLLRPQTPIANESEGFGFAEPELSRGTSGTDSVNFVRSHGHSSKLRLTHSCSPR